MSAPPTIAAHRAEAIARLEQLPASRPARRALTLDGRAVQMALGVLGIAIVLGVWELAVVTGVLPELDIPRASTVLGELWHQFGTSEFWSIVGQTASAAAIGLLIAMAIGIPLGITLGASAAAQRALRPTIEFLRPVPGIALVPVAAVIWGPARGSDVFLVAFGCIWPLLTQTIHGVHSVDGVALTTAKSLRLGLVARIRWVYFPGSLPYIVTGMRIAIAFALIIAIGAEILLGSPGIGTQIRLAQSSLDLPQMYALVISTGLLGMAVSVLASGAERRLLRWHPSQHRGGR